MIGRSIEEIDVKENEYLKKDQVILSVNNISQYGNFKYISFDLKRGEILGFALIIYWL